MFPEFAKRIFVVNAPSVVQMLYNLVKHVLAKHTKEKIEILGADWRKHLRDDLGKFTHGRSGE